VGDMKTVLVATLMFITSPACALEQKHIETHCVETITGNKYNIFIYANPEAVYISKNSGSLLPARRVREWWGSTFVTDSSIMIEYVNSIEVDHNSVPDSSGYGHKVSEFVSGSVADDKIEPLRQHLQCDNYTLVKNNGSTPALILP
jgi:hypothetical protein